METCLRKYLVKVPELSKHNKNGRFQVHFHAFRKFFYTTVSNVVGADYANAIIGHHFYLDTYYNLPEAKRREMYLKAEPHLTISDFTKIEKDLITITEKQKQIETDYYHLLEYLGKSELKIPKVLEKFVMRK